MDGPVKNIILTSDYQEKGSADYENLSTDVIVQFENGDKYIAAFISAKSSATISTLLTPISSSYFLKACRQGMKVFRLRCCQHKG